MLPQDSLPPGGGLKCRSAQIPLSLALLGMVGMAGCGGDGPAEGRTPMPTESQVRAACTSCHVFAPPEILPKAAWIHALRSMYRLAEAQGVEMPITFVQAGAWYLENAPERLPPAPGRTDAGPGKLTWDVRSWSPGGVSAPEGVGEAPGTDGPGNPAVTHLRTARLLGGAGEDLLVSDAANDRVYAVQPYLPGSPARMLGEVPQPARLEVVDLDGDGRLDLVVAALGQLRPTNDPVGSVVWLRQLADGTFHRVVLADGLGRVADVRAVDLNGNGRLDLLVAAFGWVENGRLLWLENLGSGSDGTPTFQEHILDPRAGFTDVRTADLDGDGRLEVVALVTQAAQQVMVYRPELGSPGAPLVFRPEVAYAAPHPDWGFSGLEVVDFTGDGSPDILVTNGDGLDITVAKPHHGVGLLENGGDGGFHYHHLTHMYGAHRAEPVDLNGNGLLDLVVAAYMPPALSLGSPQPSEALLWLERTGPTTLVRRVLDPGAPTHMSLTAGDVTGDGLPDLAAGWMDLGVADTAQAFQGPSMDRWVTLWLNEGERQDSGERDGATGGECEPGSDGCSQVIQWTPWGG